MQPSRCFGVRSGFLRLLLRAIYRFSILIACFVIYANTSVARDLAKLLPTSEELPKGVSLVKPTPELLKGAPDWAKTNPAIVTSAADRKEALTDSGSDTLDLTRLRNLAIFVFDCETPTTTSTTVAAYAVELADSSAVGAWQKIITEAKTKFRVQKVRFTARGPLLLWFVYIDDPGAEEQCVALEKVITKKLDGSAK